MTKKKKGYDHKYIGSLTVPQIRRLTLQVQASMLEIEKEIAKATKGIDPTREKDIQFAVNNLVAKWQTGEKTMPANLSKLNLLLRSAPDKESRGLQIISRIALPTIIPGGGHKLSLSGKRDFTRTLLIDKNIVRNPQSIYDTLDKLNALHRTLNDIQGTKYSQDLDTSVLAEFGIKLDANEGSLTPVNAYYSADRDLSLKGAHIVDRDNAREAFKKDYPLQYRADPSRFRATLNKANNYYKAGNKPGTGVTSTSENSYGPLDTLSGTYKKRDFQGDWRKGEDVWTGRDSGRSFHQANADTRALLIEKGANPRQVNLLSNDDLSRYRISGGLESEGRLQLLGDNRISLKLDKNKQFNSGGYGVTNDSSGNSISTVLPKNDLSISKGGKEGLKKSISKFETKLANSFPDPED